METDIINRAKKAITEAFPLAIKYKVIHFGPTDIPGAIELLLYGGEFCVILIKYGSIHNFYSKEDLDVVINSLPAPTRPRPDFECLIRLENFLENLEALKMLPQPIREAVSEYLKPMVVDPGSLYVYFYNDKLVESARRRILRS